MSGRLAQPSAKFVKREDRGLRVAVQDVEHTGFADLAIENHLVSIERDLLNHRARFGAVDGGVESLPSIGMRVADEQL
jgi:hypothetical protein